MRRTLVHIVAMCMVALVTVAAGSPADAKPDAREGSFSRQEMRIRERNIRQMLREHSDPSGRVRPDLWRRGIEQWQSLPLSTTWRTRSGVSAKALMSSSGPITGSQWSQIGPQPIRVDSTQQFQGAGPNSGEVVGISVDPRGTTDQTMYLAGNGGVWKTTDGGAHWAPKTDQLPTDSVGSVAVDPSNPSIVYAGSGNVAAGSCIFFMGVGLYKSTDGGDTWSVLGGSLFNGVGIYKVVALPGNVVLLGTSQGLYRSADGGAHFGNNSPNFDNGQAILPGFITDLDADTATANTVYASVGTYGGRCGFSSGAATGVFRSTDAGQTFTNLFTNSNGGVTASRVTISFAQSTTPDNQTMYASLGKDASNYGELLRSTDGGANWTTMSATGLPTTCQCRYDNEVAVDPNNASRVYVGFVDLWLSTDGGANFSQIGGNNIHDDLHALVFSPHDTSDPTTLYVGSDGGIHKTDNAGSTWDNSLNETISTNLFFQIDIGRGSSANNGYSFGGTQDTGTLDHRPGDAGLDWHLGIDGDGGAVAVDPSNPQVAFSGGNNCLNKTTNGGTNWSAPANIPSGVCGGQIAVDPNNGNNVFVASGGGLYRSTAGGDNLASIYTAASSANISDIDMTQIDSNTVWLGLDNGKVAVSTNALAGSPSFTEHTVTGAPAGQGVTGIAVDPTNTQTAVVVYGGLGAGSVSGVFKHVFRTTDGGSTWTNVSGSPGGAQNLPDLPLHSVVIDPGTNPHSIIVASDTGVARTLDGGGTWQRLGVGLPNVDSTSLQIDSSASPPVLRLGTVGRSVFELTAPTGPVLAVNADLAFGDVGVGEKATRIVQVFNVGSSDLHVVSFNRIAGDPDFTIVSGPAFPVTVAPGEEIDYTMQFQPAAAGARTATFQIASDDPSSPFSLTATGNGVTGNIALSGSLDFGTVARGTSATRDVTVQNTGGGKLRVSNVTVTGDSAFSLVGNPGFPQTILPGDSVVYTVRFSPPSGSNATPRTATLTVSSDDPDTPNATIEATGTPGVPVVSLAGNDLQFGSVPVDDRTAPNSSAIVLEITNQASCPLCDLKVTSLPITGPAGGDFSLVGAPSLPATIGAGGHLDLTVQFNPSADGARTGTLTVNTDDPVNPSLQVSLTGTGLLSGIGVLPDPIIFGPTVFDPQCGAVCGQTTNATVTNTGQAELIVDGIAFTPTAFSGPGATNPPARVAPNASFTEPVTFHPSGSAARAVSGSMSITQTVTGTISVQKVVPLCGESVGRGIRVLTLDAAGNPYPSVDRITLQSFGVKSKVNVDARNLALQTIDPPTSCQTIRFHYENQALPATDTANQKSSYYVLKVIKGNKSTTMTFTLGANEFKTIVVRVG